MASKMSKRTWIIVAVLIIAIGTIVGSALSCDCSSPSEVTWSIITWDETTLSTLEGTPVVLNFWTTWCTYCKQQMPYLEAVAQQSEAGVEVVAISVRDSASKIQSALQGIFDYEPTMTIAMDSNAEAFVDYCQAYGNTRGGVPFTLFADSEGTIQYAKLGPFQSETELWSTLHDVFGIAIPETS